MAKTTKPRSYDLRLDISPIKGAKKATIRSPNTGARKTYREDGEPTCIKCGNPRDGTFPICSSCAS